jgi:class 3 adenylate cyclase
MAAAASRRTVTVLFCDLVGSTGLGEQLDPEALRHVLGAWHTEMARVVERHGGIVEKFIGDALMAVFGVPHVHEDDALRAVRAALEMRERAKTLDRPLSMRIGINTGEVVTGDGRTALVTGDAVNTAKRLEEAAATGEILIGAPTRALVEHATELGSERGVTAKGKEANVATWPVVASITGADVFARRLDARLIGRKGELAELRAELDVVEREQRCRLVTLLGAAGVGKSRLAREASEEFRARARVLSARCVPYGNGLTFLPIDDLVRSAGGRSALLAAVADEPDASLIGARLESMLDPASQQPTEETFWAIRRVLEAMARVQPVALWVEDVHWAETTFLDLIEYVVGWTVEAPILILCMARPDLLDRRPHWGGRVLTIDPLPADASRELLAELAAEWPVPGDSLDEIAETGEGNPLFLEQLVAMLAQTGRTELPPTIQAVLAARLDQLEPRERELLERASVVGRDFLRSAAISLLPPADRPGTSSTLLSLVRKDLIAPQRTSVAGDDGFRFRHALIRDAAYAGIAKAVRAQLHAQYAAHLDRHEREDELVGYHLEQSYRYGAELGMPDDAVARQAASLLAGAGRRAFLREDMPAATNLLERALALGGLDEERPELLRALGLARWRTGNLSAASEATEQSIEVAAAAGDLRAEWYARLDRAARRRIERGGVEELETEARQAIRVFAALGDERGLALAWRRLALAAMSEWQFSDAVQHAETALRHARLAGDASEDAGLADVLCTSLMFGAEHAATAERRCRRLLLELDPAPAVTAAVSSSLACLVAMQGSFVDARELVGEAAGIYDELGLVLPRAGLAEVAAWVELLAGDLDGAQRELQFAFDVFSRAGSLALAGYHAAQLARLAARRSQLEIADAQLAFAEAHCDRTDRDSGVELQLAEAAVALAHEERGTALAHADRVLADVAGTEHLSYRADALALRAAIRGEAPVEAVALYERKGNVAAVSQLRGLPTGYAPR